MYDERKTYEELKTVMAEPVARKIAEVLRMIDEDVRGARSKADSQELPSESPDPSEAPQTAEPG